MSEQLHAETMQPEGLDLHYEDVAQQSALSRLGDRISEFASGAVESARFNARRLAALGATATTLAAGGLAFTESAPADNEAQKSLPSDPTTRVCAGMLKKTSVHYRTKITSTGESNGIDTYFGKVKVNVKLPDMSNCPGERETYVWGLADGHKTVDAVIIKGEEAVKKSATKKAVFTDACRDGKFTVKLVENSVYIDPNDDRTIVKKKYSNPQSKNIPCK